MYVLYFGNRNYSSWSLRAWLMLKGFDIPFEERVVALAGQGASDVHRAYSDNGLVPCLHDGAIRVWETLAIAEYLAERHAGLWPADAAARANARSVSAEMHAGFTALRSAMPMNIKLRLEGRPPASAVQRDIARIAEIWTRAKTDFPSDQGPYLYGAFSLADAMFAPVVWRLHCCNVALPPLADAYRQTMLANPAMREWAQAALAEPALEHYDRALLESQGGPR